MRTPGLEKYRALLEKALAHGGEAYTVEDVDEMIAEQDAQLWTAPGSFIITQVLRYPRKKMVLVWLAGGNIHEIEQMVPRAEAWAKAEGCDGAMCYGRAGWERSFLARTGWKRTLVLLEKTWQDQA